MKKQIDKTGLFKDYYYPLISEVFKIEKKEGKSEYYLEFLSKFISEDALSKETTEFRNALIKEIKFIQFIQNNPGLITISEEFGKNELPSDDSKLKELAKKLVDCVEQKQELTVSDFEDYHVALATEVINPETKKFCSSFINPKKDTNKKKLRDFFKTEIVKIRQIKEITNEQLKSIEFTVSRDFGESKLPNNDSKLEKLAETLANAIKNTEELKPSLSEEFKNYHVVLAKEVIDINTKQFQEIFIHGKVKKGNNIKQLSTLSKEFRRILLDKMVNADQVQSTNLEIKVSKGFMEEFKPENTPKIQDVQEFAKQIKELLSKSINEKKVVEINENSVAKEKFNIFKANIKKLAGYVLIEKFNKVRFSTSFLYSGELPGNLKNFRDKLKSSLEQEAFELIYEYEFDIKVKGFKTCEDGELYRKLPVVHSDGDVNDFFSKLKFVVNYPNRIGVNDLLEGEIKDKFKMLDSKAFNSLYQEDLHNWMADRIGTFYTTKKAKILFQKIQNNLSLWTIDGFNKSYFANASKKYKFQKYTVLNEFLSNDRQQVLHLVFEDLALGRTRIVQTFKQLHKGDSANIQKYTRDFGHIFLSLKQLDDPDLRSMVCEVLKDKSKFNLIVIECNTQKEIEGLYKKLFEVLQLQQPSNNKKFIFITTQEHNPFTDKFVGKTTIVDNSSFHDLESDSKNDLLKEKAITFQGGKEKTSLEKLIGIQANNIIDTETLVKFIKNEEINIGHNLPIFQGYNKDYYISRQFNQQIILNEENFQKDLRKNGQHLASDFFVISVTDSGLTSDNKNIHVFDKYAIESARSKFKELCEQNERSNIHWLKSDLGKLTWYQSHGSISNLVKYREIDKVNKNDYKISKENLIDEEKLVNQDNNKIVIIADVAGMGKSIVLTDLSLKLKNSNPNLWVIRIDLNDYTALLQQELEAGRSTKQNFSKDDVNSAIKFLLNTLLGSQEQSRFKTNLEKELFKNSFNGQGKIALLFDGFDEISPNYQDIVIDLLKAFKESKVEKLFVTTRPNMRELLESKLEVFAHVLEPFSEENQIEFLTKFWIHKLNLNDLSSKDDERLNIYAKSLIKQFSSSINDKTETFSIIGIPLQARMLAEIFQSNQEGQQETWQGCKEFLNSEQDGIPQLPKKLDLFDLYERFVKRKFYKFHWQDKKGIDFTKTGMKKDFEEKYENFKKKHEILALHRLFSDEDVEKLLSQAEIQKLNIWLEDIKSAEHNEGIIDQIIYEKPHFIHLTFAEYFTADLLAHWLAKPNGRHPKYPAIEELLVTKILLEPDYKVMRLFLNNQFTKSQLSSDIFKLYAQRITELWSENKDKFFNKEHQTALHISVQENNQAIIKLLLDIFQNKEKELIAFISVRDDDNKTALRRAAELYKKAKNKEEIEKIVKLFLSSIQNVEEDIKWKLLLATTFVSVQDKEKEEIKYLLNECKNSGLKLEGIVNEINEKYQLVTEFLQEVKDKKFDRAKKILENEKNLSIRYYLVLTKDYYDKTALYFAAESNNLNMVKYLVEHGADVKGKDYYDKTALHLAAKSNNYLTEEPEEKFVIHDGGHNSVNQDNQIRRVSNQNKDSLESMTLQQPPNYEYWLSDLDIRRIAHRAYRDIFDVHAMNNDYETSDRGLVIVQGNEQELGTQIQKFTDNIRDNSIIMLQKVLTRTFIVNQENNHWITLIIAYKNRQYYAYYVDSSGNQILDNIRDILKDNNIETIRNPGAGLRQQTDGHNCGLWALENARDIKTMLQENRDLIWLEQQLNPERLGRDNEKYFIDQRKNFAQILQAESRNMDSTSVTEEHAALAPLISSASSSSCSSDSISISSSHSRKKRAIWSCSDREEESGKQKIVKTGKWDEVVKWLIEEKGADISAKDEFGRTILHKATEFGHLDLVKWLVEKRGADVNTPDKYNTNLLHFATVSGNVALVKWLIEEQHTAIELQDKFGKSALHLAVLDNYKDIVELLVAKNADINLRDRNGETALDLARKEQHQEIIKQLQKASIELENKQYIEISLDNLTELQEQQKEIGLKPSGSISSAFGCNTKYRTKRHIGSCQEEKTDNLSYEPLEESVSQEQARASKIYTQVSMAVILKNADQFSSNNNSPLNHILTYNKYIGEIISEQKANNSPRDQEILAHHYQQAQQFLKDYPETKLLKKIEQNSDEIANTDDNQSWLFDNGQQSMLVFKEGNHYGLYSQDFNYKQKFQTKENLTFKQLEGFIKAFFKWRSSKYQIFTLADTAEIKLIEQLKHAKFWHAEQIAPDNVLLSKTHLGLIESIPASIIRKLFLLHGHSPDIAGLHADFFAHNKNDISLRFEVLHEVLQSLNIEQRQTLMAVIKKYNITIDRTYLNTLSGDEKSLLELYYNKVTNKLKMDVTITPQLLSELSWESLSDGVANHPDISRELAGKIVNSNKQVHEAASKGAMLKGMATQGLFFLPDIIRAVNSGDISNLEQTGAMMAGDAAINHLYSALVNKLATIMPAGQAELLGKLPVTSPIFKALTIYSIVELHKQLASLPANSEERSIIKHKLGEQYVTAGLMVAELLGFEVTPLWIGLIAEQLIFDATSFRKQNHLDIPFWEALAMSLGFEQDKLQNILEERQLVEMNLALVNQINNQTQIPYGLTIVKIPKLGKLKWQNINKDQIPEAISKKINDMPEEVISKVNSPEQRILESDGFRQVNNYHTISNDFAMDGDVTRYRGKLISSIWQKASCDAYPQKSNLAFALHHNNMNSFKHEDNIFLDQLLVNNVSYQRIPSKATGIFLNGQDVLKRSEVEAAVYLSTEAYRNANAQSNFYVGFDPREGDIELEFTSQGLERIDTMNVMRYFATKNIAMHNSLNNTSPYMVTIQVASKPYPDSLEFAKGKGEFSVQDNSQRIISQYVINDNIDYVIKDFTSATRISFISNLEQQAICNTIRSEPNTIFILKWQCNNKIVNGRNKIEYLNLTDISGRILISEDKKYLQLILNNHVIDSHLKLSAEHVDIIEAKGRLDKSSKIDIWPTINSFNITLRGDIIVNDQATYLQMSGKVASILPAIIYAKSAHNKVISLYECNVGDLQPILETMLRSNNSEFIDIKFSGNDVQYHWHNKLPINNTLQIAGRLDGKRGLLQIEPKSDTLQIFNDDNRITTIEIAHYDASAILENGLILHKVFRTIEPNVTDITNSGLVINTGNIGNILEFNIASYYGQADVLEFQTPSGYLLYHYFPINRIIKLNNINYIVKNQMICASAEGQDIIDGHELIKYGAISNLGHMGKMVGICFPQLLAESKILVKNDTLRINDLTLKYLEDSTKLYFGNQEIYSVKILKDSVINNHAAGIAASSPKHIEKQHIAKQKGQEYLVNLHNSSKTIDYNQLKKVTIMLNNSRTGELKVTANNNNLLFVESSSNYTLRIKNWPSDDVNNSDNSIVTLKFDQLSPGIEISAINKFKLSEVAKIQSLVSKAELSYEIAKKLEQLDAKIVNDLKYVLVSSHKVDPTGNHCLGFKSSLEQQEFISSYSNYNQKQLQKILNHNQIIKALTWLIAKDYNDLSLQEPSKEKTELVTTISKCYGEVISKKIMHRLLKHLEEGNAISKIEKFIRHHEQELQQKIISEFKTSKVTISFTPESLTEILDSETQQHIRIRRAVDENNENEMENTSDHVISSAASSMSSPINNMVSWLKSSIGGVLLSNVLNPVNKINWFTAENIKSSSIDAKHITDGSANSTTKNSASIKSVDYAQFNLNDSLTLADFIIRKITKVKPDITKEEPLNLLEVQGYVLNIIAGFEEILEKYAKEKDMLMEELAFNPITLQKQLISEIVNGSHSNVVKILYKSLEKTQLATKATKLKHYLQDKITEMLEKQQDMLLANEPLIDNRQDSQLIVENTGIFYNIADIENYGNVTTNCQVDVGLIG